ncbi:hypothetical protein SDC9_75154 [bioreactor metagenome]|uniref:Nitroreductase domain-containing protein n=1 Tax=bioreactor metagenome TaxID=1076179 RepID=A0A644YKW0_9ZZZZ
MESTFLNLEKLCKSRSSCRRFKPGNIPESAIEKIITIAKLSPYAGGRKNWDILAITDKTLKQSMANAIEEKIVSATRDMDKAEAAMFRDYGKNFLFFTQAPVLLVPYFRISPVMQALLRQNVTNELLQWERDNSVKSISCVSMLVLLAAESLVLGACYMTGPLIAKEEIGKILALPPGKEPGAIIPVGYPDK